MLELPHYTMGFLVLIQEIIMTNRKKAPYGSWKSPISSDLIVAETVGAGAITPAGEDVYWLEIRFVEAGRYVLVRRSADGSVDDITPHLSMCAPVFMSTAVAPIP